MRIGDIMKILVDSFEKKKYAALIVDIKSSRTYDSAYRNNMQNYLYDTITILNDIFRESIEKKVEFSAGDEMQGLFSSAEAAYLYFRWLNMLASPIKLRAGIGVGIWNVVLENAGTTAQDGPAYHNARYAIDTVKNIDGYSVLLYSGGSEDLVINSTINTSTLIINKDSEHQVLLMILTEIMYPIYIENTFSLEKLSLLEHALKNKYIYNSNKPYGHIPNKTYEFISYSSDYARVIYPVLVEFEDDSFYVTNGKTRGIATNLSNMLNIRRQSIDYSVRASNLYEARNSAIITLKMMGRFL